jgi:hypothetical protein
LLHKLSANWAPHPIVVVESREAFCAESVSTVDEYTRNLLSDVELLATVVAEVKTSALVISLQKIFWGILLSFIF